MALTPASWIYEAGWRIYRATYDCGIKRAREPHCPVFCVGNLSVGGSGKSPLTLHLTKVLQSLGTEVVVSCSGYGSSASEAAQLAPNGPLKASQWGDEPAMMRLLSPDLPLIVGRRRVLAAKICNRTFPNAALLLDDGFQHMPLRKHVSILLRDESSNRRCLPAGPYREPASFEGKADLVLPGHFVVTAAPAAVQTADGTGVAPTKVRTLCALARPGKFTGSLQAAGFEILDRRALADHDPLTEGNLFDGWPKDQPIVVTTKDWVKLRDRPDICDRTVWICHQEVSVEPRLEFRNWIETRLNELSKKR